MNEYKLSLLKSIIEKAKYLDMGKSPVSAIQACWEMEKDGYVWIDASGWVHITQKGMIEVVNSGAYLEETK